MFVKFIKQILLYELYELSTLRTSLLSDFIRSYREPLYRRIHQVGELRIQRLAGRDKSDGHHVFPALKDTFEDAPDETDRLLEFLLESENLAGRSRDILGTFEIFHADLSFERRQSARRVLALERFADERLLGDEVARSVLAELPPELLRTLDRQLVEVDESYCFRAREYLVQSREYFRFDRSE